MERFGTELFGWYVTCDITASSAICRHTPVYQMEVASYSFPINASNFVFVQLLLYRLKSARVTDKRIRVMNEIISGMRLIKMYAWEWAFHEYVKRIRK